MENKIKVLMVADGDSKYGAPHSLCQMVEKLNSKEDVEVTVVVNHKSEMSSKLEESGIKVFVIPYQPYYQGFPWKKWRYPFKYVIRGAQYRYGRAFGLKKLARLVDLNSFDIIHANSSREDFGALIAEKYNKPLVWHIREFGDLDYKCFSFRNDYIDLMNRTATVLIAVSDAVREHWIRKGIKPEKIVRVYNGVDEQNAPSGISRDNDGIIRLVIAGSIQEAKGQVQAVQLAGILKKRGIKAHLDIIGGGSGPYIREIEKQVKYYKAEDRVSFLGYKSNVQELLGDYDVGLVCSRSEGFGRVTAEYMMAGLPVLASDTGANKELIREGIDGLTYKYGDIEDMADKLIDIVKIKWGGWRHIRMRFMNSQAA